MPCGTLLLPSPTSCGWAAACSPWSCDTASRPCCQVLRLPPLRLQCNHLRHHRWPHPRCSGSRGGAGGGYLDGGCSLLDSRWPRHIESQPAPSTPGGWLTLSQRLLRCCHLKHDQRLLPTLLFAVTNIYGEMSQIMKVHWLLGPCHVWSSIMCWFSPGKVQNYNGLTQVWACAIWMSGSVLVWLNNMYQSG